MRKLGGYMMIFGLLALGMSFFDLVPRILQWIYTWGQDTAYLIMGGFIVAGGGLYFLAGRGSAASKTPDPDQTDKPAGA